MGFLKKVCHCSRTDKSAMVEVSSKMFDEFVPFYFRSVPNIMFYILCTDQRKEKRSTSNGITSNNMLYLNIF